MSYEFTSCIRFSEIGPDGRLTLGGLIDYLQDCCVFHSRALGLGPVEQRDRGAAWLVCSWRILIKAYPLFGESITMKTWSYYLKGFEGRRNLTMRDQKGREVACADSRWIFYDLKNQRPMRIPPEEMAYGEEEKLALPEMPRHLKAPDGGIRMDGMTVQPYQVDTNHHMNNAQYVRMAAGFLPENFETGELWVDFLRQAKEGDRICPRIMAFGNDITVALENEAASAYAVLVFKRKQ